MKTFEMAEDLVKNDIMIKTNTALSIIDDFVKLKQGVIDYVMPIISQRTVALSIKWKMLESLGLVENLANGYLFSEDWQGSDDEIKKEIIDDIVANYEHLRDNTEA